MRDVIQQIVATEVRAKQEIKVARDAAARMVTDARKQAQEMVAAALQSARLEAERTLTTAMQAAEADKRELLARVAAEIETNVRLDETAAQQAAEAAVRCVCGLSSKGNKSP